MAALEPLHDALTHDDAGVRAAALLALGDLSDPAAVPDLCDISGETEATKKLYGLDDP